MPINYQADQELFQGQDSEFSAQASLPFAAPLYYVMNGVAAAKGAAAPALYFGGWATDQDTLDGILRTESRALPAGMVACASENREGGPVTNYTIRSVFVSPICYRQSWLGEGRVRFNHFVEGARRHVQILAELAEFLPNKSLRYWGPVVLSAKGFQAKNLLQSVGDWEKATALARSEAAPGVPAWAFWMAIGTFGPNRNQVLVGSAKGKSPITPIVTMLPDKIDEALLERLYLGTTAIKLHGEHLNKAADWKGAWGTNQTDGNVRQNASAADQPFVSDQDDVPF